MKQLLWFIIWMNMTVLWSQELPPSLKYDEVEFTENGRYALIRKGKKQGLYDLNKSRFAIEMDKNSLIHFRFSHLLAQIDTDTIKYFDLQVDTSRDIISVDNERYRACDIYQLSENQYVVSNYENEFLGLSPEGDFTFDWANPRLASGLLNVKSKQWIIPRKYADIYLFENEISALRYDSVYLKEPGNIYSGYLYEHSYDSYIREEGAWLLNREKIKFFAPNEIKRLLQFDKLDTIGLENYYLTEKHGKKGLLYFNENSRFEGWRSILTYDQKLTNQFDFIHLNKKATSLCAVDTSSQAKVFIYSINERSEIKLIETGAEFVTIKHKDNNEESVFSVHVNRDIIVINDRCNSPYWITDEIGEYYEIGIDEQEASAIWRLKSTGCEKISPIYAEVITVKDKFIARTKEYTGEFMLTGGEGYAMFDENRNPIFTNQITPRYIYLDENANPVPFIDYYDFNLIKDLGFGLHFETDKGAFFVTYEGKAITNDDWDYFELKDERLKAVKRDPNTPKNGLELHDEIGELIPPAPPTIKYFDL